MASKLKRRSSMGINRMNLSLNHSIDSQDLEAEQKAMEINDVQEQEERRARKGIHKRLSLAGFHHGGPGTPGLPGTPGVGPGTPGTPSAVSGYSAAQLSEHYTNCMKLSAENKINIKNAFQLKLIDFMSEMLRKKKSDMDNFQAASCALDASTKIYAYRVDSVHNETMKLASGVGKGKNDQADEGEPEVDENGEKIENREKKKKKRKKASTVEKNLSNINCGRLEMEFAIDPLYKKISAQFDTGTTGGLLLSTLRMRDDSGGLLLDSDANLQLVPETVHEEDDNEIGYDLDEFYPNISENCLICPTFSTFSFIDWTLEKELNSESQEDAPQTFTSTMNQDTNDEHVFDINAVENDDFQDDNVGLFGDNDDVEIADDREDCASPNRLGIKPVGLMGKQLWEHLSLVPDEYSYFDTGRLNAWAGPKHWKFRTNIKGTIGAGIVRDEDKKKKKKQNESIDFEIEDKGNSFGKYVDSVMALPKKPIALQNKTLDNWKFEKNMLPENIDYSGKDLVKMSTLKNVNVVPKTGTDSQTVDDSVADYDFDNANDTQNFCPDIEGDAHSYPVDNEETHLDGFTNVYTQNSTTEGLDLVSAPNKVEKVQIGYAKLAKKIDMRKLKSVEWSILQETITLEDKENELDASNQTGKNTTTRSLDTSEGIQFNRLYKTLRLPNALPTKMNENLTPPLAFVALLHLCNEQNLELCGTDELNEIFIRRG